jgi:hypothetical protein
MSDSKPGKKQQRVGWFSTLKVHGYLISRGFLEIETIKEKSIFGNDKLN